MIIVSCSFQEGHTKEETHFVDIEHILPLVGQITNGVLTIKLQT